MPLPTSRWSTLTLNQFIPAPSIVVTVWVPLFGGAMDYDGRSHSDFKVSVTKSPVASPAITPNGVKPIIYGEATGPPSSLRNLWSHGLTARAELVVDASASVRSSWAENCTPGNDEKFEKLEEKLVELKFATSKYPYVCRCCPPRQVVRGRSNHAAWRSTSVSIRVSKKLNKERRPVQKRGECDLICPGSTLVFLS